MALVSGAGSMGPHKLVGVVAQDVKRHAGGAEQSDDITILSLELNGPSQAQE